jgi:hypothetical protein
MSQLAGLKTTVKNATPSIPLVGLRGITIAISGNLSVKINTYNGRGMSDVKITLADGTTYFTDSNGNALLTVTGVDIQLTLSKYKLKRTVSVPNGVSQVEFKFGKPIIQ